MAQCRILKHSPNVKARHPGKLLAGIMKVSRRVFVRDPGQKLAGMTTQLTNLG